MSVNAASWIVFLTFSIFAFLTVRLLFQPDVHDFGIPSGFMKVGCFLKQRAYLFEPLFREALPALLD